MNSSTAVNSDAPSRSRLSNDFDLLRRTPFFSGLHLDVIKLLAYLTVHRSYRPGDPLIEQGKKADRAFVLINGSVDVSVLHRGNNVILQQLKEGDFFGELALLAQFDWFFTIKAVDNVEALIIDRATFQKVLEKFPEHKDTLIERVIQLRVERLIDQTSFMLDKFLSSDQKPATALI